jgi:UDP-N-acetylmuramoylalanine--D-glutamate ligase
VHDATDGVELLDGVGTLVKSPGVPQEAPVVRAARERGLTVVGELELGWRLLPNDVIAITGSNGKTTTTELVGQIHREAGLPVAVAGNVGTALTTLIGTLDPRPSWSPRRPRSSWRTRSRWRRTPRSC